MKKQIIYLTALFIGGSFALLAQNRGGMGMTMNKEAYSKTPLIDKPLGFGANLPKSMTLKQYCPTVQSQGNEGTCTAWSSTYYAATMEYAILNNLTSANDIASVSFDPYYTYLNIIGEESKATNACQDGSYPGDACELLVTYGAKRKSVDPFSCSSTYEAAFSKEETCVIDFTNYNRLFKPVWEEGAADSFNDEITAICQALVNKHPVIMGMTLLESFYNIGADGKYDSKNGGQDVIGGHAMCIIGYDDNKFGGSFQVVNSWGADWGERGYLYITYKDFYEYGMCAFSLESEMKSFNTAGCKGGDCDSGYGVMKYADKKLNGVFEGNFEKGKMTSGIYTNLSGTISAKELKTIQKVVSKNSGSFLIYKNYDIVGFVRPY